MKFLNLFKNNSAKLKDLDIYKHAFETTATDRDRISAELTQLKASHQSMANSYIRLQLRGQEIANDTILSSLLPYTLILSRPKSAGTHVRSIIEESNFVGRLEHTHALSPKSIAKFRREHPWSKSKGHDSMMNALGVLSYNRALRHNNINFPPPSSIIFLARDPIHRAISELFFFTAKPNGVYDSFGLQCANKLTMLDVECYLSSYNWNRDDEFLNDEFDEHLEVNIPNLSSDSPYSISKGVNPVLFIRTDRINLLPRALSELNGYAIELGKQPLSNSAADNGYGNHYKDILKNLKLNSVLINQALSTRFASTFFSVEDRNMLRKKWG